VYEYEVIYNKDKQNAMEIPYIYPFKVGLRKLVKNSWKITLSLNSSMGFRKIPTLLRSIG